jgi:hypothetical protein
MDDTANDDAGAGAPRSVRVAPETRPFGTRVTAGLETRRARAIVWAVVSLIAAAFVAFGRVTVYVADGDERRLSIVRVWTLLANGLPSVNHATLMNAVFVSSLLVLIVTSLAALWLALVSVGPTATTTKAAATIDDGEPLVASEGTSGRVRP